MSEASSPSLAVLRKQSLAYESALATQVRLGATVSAARSLGGIAKVHEDTGDHASALAYAHRVASLASTFARGLGSEEGAGSRERLGFVYDVGVHAAVAVNDAPELSFFLESGRAGALIEGLDAREALQSAEVSPSLRAEESEARAAEVIAVKALRRALNGGNLAEIKTRRGEMDGARERVSGVVSRIQRAAKAGASLVYPIAATLDEIRATLVDGDALVLYGMPDMERRMARARKSTGKVCALVVTRGGHRVVELAMTTSVEAAVEALNLVDLGTDPAEALASLSQLIVGPLDLTRTTRRVFVSPVGVLASVPFAALLPSVTVVYAASGTTYRMLQAAASLRGEGVLALGDPDYVTKVDEQAVAVNRGALGRLTRLPATKEEAKAVGTVTLLGGEATEAGLTSALAKQSRWRAVHFACHGLVNTERPALSSLAITAAGDDDGFLTCLDVFRIKIPADLVVLSACETGKGRIVKSEGIVGFTRAFMFAGAPRVICSLWKVDDDATKALMVKFYELWNPKDGKPGIPTAEALRKAQEFVRVAARSGSTRTTGRRGCCGGCRRSERRASSSPAAVVPFSWRRQPRYSCASDRRSGCDR